jgi:hypothetical protein
MVLPLLRLLVLIMVLILILMLLVLLWNLLGEGIYQVVTRRRLSYLAVRNSEDEI